MVPDISSPPNAVVAGAHADAGAPARPLLTPRRPRGSGSLRSWLGRGGWLDLAWLLLWAIGLAPPILMFERRESVPFLLIWISFAVLFGALVGVMIWHARHRQAAEAQSTRISLENSRLLAAQVRFLQDASHQLRTPITIALGHAELLARSVADRAEKRDVCVVVGELNRLRRLSERLLVIAASENPEFLSHEPVALGQLTAEALRRWEPAAQRRWQLGQPGPATVEADGERLRLALDALLENAVQHTGPDDSIRLSVLRDPGSSLVGLVVEDSGSGISDAEIAYIFDRFRTGSGAAGHGGTGLGLPLVLAVARGHGGEVRVRSAPGQGTRFELLLPEHPADGRQR